MDTNVEITVFKPEDAGILKTFIRSALYSDHQHDAEKMILKVGDQTYRFHPDEVPLSDALVRALAYNSKTINAARTDDITITGIDKNGLLPGGSHRPDFYTREYSWHNDFFTIGERDGSPSAMSFRENYYGASEGFNGAFYDETKGVKAYFADQKPDVTNVEIGENTYATFNFEGKTYGIDVTPAIHRPYINTGVYVLTEDGQQGPEIEGIDWQTVQDYISDNTPAVDIIYTDAGEVDLIAFEFEGQMVATDILNLQLSDDPRIGQLPGERLTLHAGSVRENDSGWLAEKYKLKYSSWDGDPLNVIGFIAEVAEGTYRSAVHTKDKALSALNDTMRDSDQFLIERTASEATFAPAQYTDLTPEIIETMYKKLEEYGVDINKIKSGDTGTGITYDPQTYSNSLKDMHTQ